MNKDIFAYPECREKVPNAAESRLFAMPQIPVSRKCALEVFGILGNDPPYASPPT